MPRVASDFEETNSVPNSAMTNGVEFPTLGQLFHSAGDISHEPTGDDTPAHHHVLDLITPEPQPTSGPPPLILSFNNLTYSVKTNRWFNPPAALLRRGRRGDAVPAAEGKKTLLNDVSGEARDGEILAVLGPSGSGKSTLIDALANRISRESLQGNVTLNGEILQPKTLKLISAYVMQEDLLFPMLTVEETLMFAAEFRLPQTLPKSNKKLRVQTLIKQLGLTKAANTLIGDEGHRGISGGERRRVSIGIDIIHDPIVLFLDEPTSGLDSASAFKVVQVLKSIALSGSIVIMSIHQPGYKILSLLDRLIFLSRGQTVLSGSPESLPQIFSEFGQSVPLNENPTEFALDFIQELEETSDGTRGLANFNKKWQQSNYKPTQIHQSASTSLKDTITASVCRPKLVSDHKTPTFANAFWKETLILSKRHMTNTVRTPELIVVRLATVLVTGFILATVFRPDDSPKGVSERLGLFGFSMAVMFFTTADALPVLIQERYIFLRETAYNSYRRSSYVISHSLSSLPLLAFISIAFSTATFWPIGLEGGVTGYLFYTLVIFASFWNGNSFITFISSVIPNVMISYMVTIAVLAYYLLLCGFFVNRDRIPVYWIWFHYISLLKYPYEAVMQNEFDRTDKCFARGIQIFDNTPLRDVPYDMKVKFLNGMGINITGPGSGSGLCLMTGSDILKGVGVSELDKWGCLWVTFAWGLFFRILFYFSLLLGNKNKRK